MNYAVVYKDEAGIVQPNNRAGLSLWKDFSNCKQKMQEITNIAECMPGLD